MITKLTWVDEDMGNHQSLSNHLLHSSCVPNRRQSYPPHAGRYQLLSIGESESGSITSNAEDGVNTDEETGSLNSDEDSVCEERLSEAVELENIILNDDNERLKRICEEKKIDINIQLNEKGETALILAVKLSKLEMVQILLLTPECDKNSVNVQGFTPLDVALVTLFDNRLEPRQTICWQIVECLLQVGAEPNSRDAMMYVIRTALKFCDEEFIYRLIHLATQVSDSVVLHELILQKLHRYQPVYMESLDPFFLCASAFTIKLLKSASKTRLCDIISSMSYYIDSYWNEKENKMNTFQKLVLYATAAGWEWKEEQLEYISRVCPNILGIWCRRQKLYPISLSHLARKSFRNSIQTLIPEGIERLSTSIPHAIRDYILLKDVDDVLQEPDFKLADIQF